MAPCALDVTALLIERMNITIPVAPCALNMMLCGYSSEAISIDGTLCPRHDSSLNRLIERINIILQWHLMDKHDAMQVQHNTTSIDGTLCPRHDSSLDRAH